MIDALHTLEREALDRLATVESNDDLARWQAGYPGPARRTDPAAARPWLAACWRAACCWQAG